MVNKYVKMHERAYPMAKDGSRKKGKVKVSGFRKRFKSVGEKRIVSHEGVTLYPITDEYGHRLGWSTKPPIKKQTTRKSFGSFKVVLPSGNTDRINGRPAIFKYSEHEDIL